MQFENAKVFSEQNFLDHLQVGHPYYPKRPAFLLLKKGFIEIREQINVYLMKEFSIILIDSNSVYEIVRLSEDLELLVIAYDRVFVEQLNFKFNRLNAYRSIRSEFKKVYPAEKSEFEMIWLNAKNIDFYVENFDQQEYNLEVVESFFTALIYQLGNIISKNRKISKQKMDRPQEIALDFIRLVSDFYKTEKSVEFYAQKMMLSTRHLSSVLKQTVGKSASLVIAEFILNDAKAQLSSTSKPINEIARELQFSDQYSFSHFFKKHEKLSPSFYRKQF